MRKELLDYLHTRQVVEGLTDTKVKMDWVTWLEKQGDARQYLERQSKPIEIKRGKTYLCTKTHKYAGEEWREGIKYFAPADYTLINQGCAYYCPSWSKEEHNNFFKEVEYAEVTPKFKVDDWITDGENTWRIAGIRKLDYLLRSQNGDAVNVIISYVDKHFHLWSIQDAKDGDVLVYQNGDTEIIMIFKSERDAFHAYTHFQVFNNTYEVNNSCVWCIGGHPATKEQRELLFAKMKEVGYEWDADKKGLKGIKHL